MKFRGSKGVLANKTRPRGGPAGGSNASHKKNTAVRSTPFCLPREAGEF